MKWSLNLGKIAGIKLLLHWTFLLLIVWVALSQYLKNNSFQESFFAVASVISIFICVVLHELGHALTARKYGIQTRRIILLPIGGIADFEKLPSNPRHEIVIAIAGPVVNIAIALVLYFIAPIKDVFLQEKTLQSLSKTQLFWTSLFSINIMLAVFNLLPAFPMDGGRILRAALTLTSGKARATRIASNIGQILSFFLVLAGFFYGNPFLVFIGIFIFFSAYSENYLMQHQEFLGRFIARDAMMTNFTKLHPEESLKEVSEKIIAGSEADFVVCENDKAIGILTYNLLIQALKENQWNLQVKDVMSSDFELIRAEENLDQIFIKLHKYKNSILPVVENHKLAGIINLTNINEFLMIHSAQH